MGDTVYSYLISNSDVAYFPENKPNSFRNRIQNNFKPMIEYWNWKIALQSIILHESFVNKPRLINVKFEGCNEQHNDSKYSEIVGRFVKNEEVPGETYNYTFERKEYFKIPSSLRELNVSILDDKMSPISFDEGATPTVLKLKFKKMTSQSTIVKLVSDESLEEFPNNYTANFSNYAAYNFNPEKSYEVALSSVIYPKSILGVMAPKTTIFSNCLRETTNKLWGVLDVSHLKGVVANHQDYIELSWLNLKIVSITHLIQIMNDRIQEVIQPTPLKFKYDKNSAGVYVSFMDKKIKFKPGYELIQTLGLVTNSEGWIEASTYLPASSKEAEKDMRNVYNTLGIRLVGSGRIEKVIPSNMYIYTNIVENICFGGEYKLPLLKIIPLDYAASREEKYYYYTAKHLDFIPVLKMSSSTPYINISCKDVTGIDIPFVKDTANSEDVSISNRYKDSKHDYLQVSLIIREV